MSNPTPNKRPMPLGDPAQWPIGSPQSRAAARAMAEAVEQASTLILIHSVPRPEYPGDDAPRERTEDGHYVLRIPLGPEDAGRTFMGIPRPRHQRI